MTQVGSRETSPGPAVSGPPIVLLTGWGSSPGVFAAFAAQLGAQFPVRIADFDFGRIPVAADAREALDLALETLAPEVPPGAVLIGWSLGGSLALRLAARHPGRLRALVCIATNPCFCARPDWPLGMPAADFAVFREAYDRNASAHLERFCALQASGDARAAQVRRALREAQPPSETHAGLGVALALLESIDLRAELPLLELPVLHVLGECDPLVPARIESSLRRLQPEASVWVAASCAHAPFLSRPEAVAARIGDFIAALDPPPQRPAVRAVARSFGRAARGYDDAAALQRGCAAALLSLAPAEDPDNVLDLGCGTGAALPALRERFPRARVLGVDIAEPMLRSAASRAENALLVGADAQQLPFADSSVGLVFSNLALQWCDDLGRACRELARVLRPGGLALLSLPGPDTLWELRAAWRCVDGREHVNRFLSLALILAAAESAGLQLERVEREERLQRHANARAVAQGLRGIGATALDAGRPAGLAGRAVWARLEAAYALLADGADGLPATWELLRIVVRRPCV